MTYKFTGLKNDTEGTAVVFHRAATGEKLEVGASDFYMGHYEQGRISERSRLDALASLIDECVPLDSRPEPAPAVVRIGDIQHYLM